MIRWSYSIALLAMSALSVLCCDAAAAQADTKTQPNEPTVTEDSAALWQTLATLDFPIETRASFRETRSSRLLRKPVNQQGTLWIDSTGDFVMQVLEPRVEERRLSEQRLSLLLKRTDRNGMIREKERSLKLDPSKGTHQLLLSIVDVLKGNTERLQSEFRIATIPVSEIAPSNKLQADTLTSEASWVIVLTPIRPALRNDLGKLVLRGQGSVLHSLRTERNASSWQEIEILGTSPTPVTKVTGG